MRTFRPVQVVSSVTRLVDLPRAMVRGPRRRGGALLVALSVLAAVLDAATTLIGMGTGQSEESNGAAALLFDRLGVVPWTGLACAYTVAIGLVVSVRSRSWQVQAVQVFGALFLVLKLLVGVSNLALLAGYGEILL